MTPAEDDRPAPETFLEAARAESEPPQKRGKLKIFLGAAPGVGKTYAMLEEAHLRRRAGVDVVAALVETHGRMETAAELVGLALLPRRRVPYRGQVLTELDVDALIERRPQLALIDELAHSNPPGSRHPKRWQDVMEVLDSGIDVLTTLNIQHIESLNDAVTRISGARVQETVPDAVVAEADAIELIDLPPDELIDRLKEGKIYRPAQAGQALENFFTRDKLTALREMALRTTAGQVDAEILSLMQAKATRGPLPSGERLMICINEAPVAKTLVRSGKRMAERARIPWLVVTVVTPTHEALGAEAQQQMQDAMRLAETLGAETVTLRAESDVAGELLRFARSRNVSRLLIGRPRWQKTPWRGLTAFTREAVSDRLLDGATDFEVTIVTPNVRNERRKAVARPQIDTQVRGYVGAVVVTAFATLLGLPVESIDLLPNSTLTVFYLLGVMLVGANYGLGPSLFASVLAFLCYNFFFIDPILTLTVAKPSEVVALSVFLLGALFTGNLASRLKAQIESMRATQTRIETLYTFARKIASATKFDDVLWAAAAHGAKALNARTLILTPDAAGALQQVQGHPSIEEHLDARAAGAAQWAFEKAEAAGTGTGTLPGSDWLFVPLATAGKPFGVFGVAFADPQRAADPETRRLLLAVEDQVAVAIERNRLAEELANARVAAESDQLRAALLNSVSHDLRTPLVTVIGAMSSLADQGTDLPRDDRQELVETALDEARRLDRYVQNLLDMTRLGHGALKPKRGAVDIREIIGRVRADLARTLMRHSLHVEVPRDLPMLQVDPVLIGQALINLLENAAKYAPAGTKITVRAGLDGKGNAEIRVIDEGPGIPVADREKVFDLFHRAARGDGAPAGTGMGLAIVRGLVAAHGGKVRADAGPGGQGAALVMTLPLAPPEDTDEESEQ
ncbi:MAG: DUF4118 domain-containing protein [Pannonibacter sp.]